MTKYPYRCSLGHRFEIVDTVNGIPQLGCKTCIKTHVLSESDNNA